MTRAFAEWLQRLWRVDEIAAKELAGSYAATFSSAPGQLVLNDLLDKIYCTVYEGTDPNEALVHNARRSVVDEILHNVDLGINPIRFDPLVAKSQEIFTNGA
jgi:hypothetical protein